MFSSVKQYSDLVLQVLWEIFGNIEEYSYFTVGVIEPLVSSSDQEDRMYWGGQRSERWVAGTYSASPWRAGHHGDFDWWEGKDSHWRWPRWVHVLSIIPRWYCISLKTYWLFYIKWGSRGGVVVKLLVFGARGPGFNSLPWPLRFQRLFISCFQVAIWLKYR